MISCVGKLIIYTRPDLPSIDKYYNVSLNNNHMGPMYEPIAPLVQVACDIRYFHIGI